MKGFAVVHIFLVAFMLQSVGFSQGWQKKNVLTWSGVKTIQGMAYKPVKVLYADGLQNSVAKNYTPVYSEKFALDPGIGSCDIIISHTEWEAGPDKELSVVPGIYLISIRTFNSNSSTVKAARVLKMR